MAQAIRKTRSSVARAHAIKKARPSLLAWFHDTFGTLGAIVVFGLLFIALVAVVAPDPMTDSTAHAAEPEVKTQLRLDRKQHLAELEAQYLGE